MIPIHTVPLALIFIANVCIELLFDCIQSPITIDEPPECFAIVNVFVRLLIDQYSLS